MSKIISLLVGAVVAILGLILLTRWWYEFLFLLRGSLPILFILGGLLALLAGFSELKDTLNEKK